VVFLHVPVFFFCPLPQDNTTQNTTHDYYFKRLKNAIFTGFIPF